MDTWTVACVFTNRWSGVDDMSELELVQDGCLASAGEAQQHDLRLLLPPKKPPHRQPHAGSAQQRKETEAGR